MDKDENCILLVRIDERHIDKDENCILHVWYTSSLQYHAACAYLCDDVSVE